MPSIEIHNVSKRYRIGSVYRPTTLMERVNDAFKRFSGQSDGKKNEIWALKDISLRLDPGEVVGVIGRNGAGKSTLLKILSKITRPTEGDIKVVGRLSSLLEVGTGFHDELTGRENIFMYGSILGMTKKEIAARLDSIVDFAGVEKFIDTPIKRYSSGMQLRLGFAVAAHLDSEILLVDEVIAVGDVEFQKKCLDTMGNLRNTGKTVLFVSHNLAAIENLCSRVIWIDGGKMRKDGAPKETVEEYMASFPHSQTDGFSLVDSESRWGTGDLRFTRIDFLETGTSLRKPIRSGDSFTMRLHFDAKKTMSNLNFGVEFQTQMGLVVAQIHTFNSGYDTPVVPPGEGNIDIEISDLNLMPGRYYLTLFCWNLGRLYHDYMASCASIDVEPSGKYGLNRGFTRNPVVLIQCRWILNDATSPQNGPGLEQRSIKPEPNGAVN